MSQRDARSDVEGDNDADGSAPSAAMVPTGAGVRTPDTNDAPAAVPRHSASDNMVMGGVSPSPGDRHDSRSPARGFSWRRFWAYTGPGWLMSMAYLDPGNLEADLQSGAYTRYELLYIVLLSTLAGGGYQLLAARLGTCTGRHLAALCRDEYPRPVALGLWLMAELAIIGSDIQEVLGSAIALRILFGLPLWLGCLVTGFDTLTFLALHRRSSSDNSNGNAHEAPDQPPAMDKENADAGAGDSGQRALELVFLMLITIMALCFFAEFTVSAPDVWEIWRGIVSPRLKEQNVMQAVASLGAIIMPHNLFLHSALVQMRGVDPRNRHHVREANFYFGLESSLALLVSFLINAAVVCVFASSFYSTACAQLSAPESLSGLAGSGIQTACIPVNTAMASGSPIYDAVTGNVCHFGLPSSICTPCYVDHRDPDHAYGFGGDGVVPSAGYCQEIGLSEAGEAVRETLGGYARSIWAIGLLASGQASTMTGTYAGQFVMEGFLEIKIAAWKRVGLTRAIAIVPAVLVAVIAQHKQFKSDHFNELLNVLQSVQLPFALLPLLSFTANKRIMGQEFATSRPIAFVVLCTTALLCALNYALVYRILYNTLPASLSIAVWLVIGIFVFFYSWLLIYLIVWYPVAASCKAPATSYMRLDDELRTRQSLEDDDSIRKRLLSDETTV